MPWIKSRHEKKNLNLSEKSWHDIKNLGLKIEFLTRDEISRHEWGISTTLVHYDWLSMQLAFFPMHSQITLKHNMTEINWVHCLVYSNLWVVYNGLWFNIWKSSHEFYINTNDYYVNLWLDVFISSCLWNKRQIIDLTFFRILAKGYEIYQRSNCSLITKLLWLSCFPRFYIAVLLQSSK